MAFFAWRERKEEFQQLGGATRWRLAKRGRSEPTRRSTLGRPAAYRSGQDRVLSPKQKMNHVRKERKGLSIEEREVFQQKATLLKQDGFARQAAKELVAVDAKKKCVDFTWQTERGVDEFPVRGALGCRGG